LADKFGLATATTNHAGARDDPQRFWRENPALVASLHTLKQPAQLEVARQVHWDILVVDEAHYLRNRESQAWQAVNALPRQYLLLLTATPVQNSLEELYNLVTLLQPGQLPSPKEFRARFLDPKRPRQPREPEELRRLLGQVMIRNTRANAGLKLPPRRAETVMFEPEENERAFWTQWDGELRAQLSRLKGSQSNLWGRLLLQTAGSSPAAWRAALEKFPEAAAARAWRDQAPLEPRGRRKCGLISPLARGEGGAVVFTQFLETQAALAEFLRRDGVTTFVINGATPAPERQPITEEFRKQGGGQLLIEGWVEGPCAESADLRGINMLMMDFADEPAFVRDMFAFCVEMDTRFAQAQIEAGADIIGIGDAAASLVGPAIYDQFIWPYEKKLVDAIRSMVAAAAAETVEEAIV